jgi:predicted heme/steroid binding protein
MNNSQATWLGFAVGLATAAYLWTRSKPGNGEEEKPKQYERHFLAKELEVFHGKDGRPIYIALCEPEDGVYDVTSKAEEYVAFAGKEVDSSVDAQKIKSTFKQMGKLVRPREYTVDELFEMDGRMGKPIWLSGTSLFSHTC